MLPTCSEEPWKTYKRGPLNVPPSTFPAPLLLFFSPLLSLFFQKSLLLSSHSFFVMKAPLFLAFLAISFALFSGPVDAFPAFQRSKDPQYAAFLKRAAEIKDGASLFEKKATNNSGLTGYEHRTLTALINPDSFQYNAEEQ